jgi:hypothetical protein
LLPLAKLPFRAKPMFLGFAFRPAFLFPKLLRESSSCFVVVRCFKIIVHRSAIGSAADSLKSSGENASGSTLRIVATPGFGFAEATRQELPLDSAGMDVTSIGNSLAAAAKIALGAVLLTGDVIVANISGDAESNKPAKSRSGKKRRMKRKKGVRAAQRPGGNRGR